MKLLKNAMPAIFVLSGILIEKSFDLFRQRARDKREFVRTRFSGLLFPLFFTAHDHLHLSPDYPLINSEEYYLRKSSEIEPVILKYSFYATEQMLSAYATFTSELCMQAVDGDSNHRAIFDSYEAFADLCLSEYSTALQKLNKKQRV